MIERMFGGAAVEVRLADFVGAVAKGFQGMRHGVFFVGQAALAVPIGAPSMMVSAC